MVRGSGGEGSAHVQEELLRKLKIALRKKNNSKACKIRAQLAELESAKEIKRNLGSPPSKQSIEYSLAPNTISKVSVRLGAKLNRSQMRPVSEEEVMRTLLVHETSNQETVKSVTLRCKVLSEGAKEIKRRISKPVFRAAKSARANDGGQAPRPAQPRYPAAAPRLASDPSKRLLRGPEVLTVAGLSSDGRLAAGPLHVSVAGARATPAGCVCIDSQGRAGSRAHIADWASVRPITLRNATASPLSVSFATNTVQLRVYLRCEPGTGCLVDRLAPVPVGPEGDAEQRVDRRLAVRALGEATVFVVLAPQLSKAARAAGECRAWHAGLKIQVIVAREKGLFIIN